jgi:hypothetical protein
MRAKEFIKEDTATADDSNSSGSHPGTTKGGSRANIHHHHATAIPGLQTIPDWPGMYYKMYRMGVSLASSPEQSPFDTGAYSNEMVFTTFTKEEQKMLDISAKEMGVNLKTLSSSDSVETDNTNKVSPVAKPKRNQYGV